jgi:trk system potassium uptake protein TrkA
MRIVIIGAGLVGTQLAKYLIQEKHDVSLIEANEERARHASNRLDCMVIHDEGNSLQVLEEAGIAKADALVCVTDSDELNMIICGLAASRYPEVLKIARVRNADYIQLSRQGKIPAGPETGGDRKKDRDGDGAPARDTRILGIDRFIHPDVEVSRSIINAIERGAMGDILSFSNTPYELGAIDVAPESRFDGLPLKDYHQVITGESLITLVERNGEVLLPSGSTTLGRGDRVHILADGKELLRIFKFAGSTEKPLRKIGIVGGGKVGTLIAEGLLDREDSADREDQAGQERPKRNPLFPLLKILIPRSSRRVVIIEQDYRLCKDLAARFPEALILNEDISDESFANEEEIDDLDLLVTTTNNQELNIITAVYLKSRGITRTIAMVTGSGYAAMARRLGVDVVIPMKSVVADSILSHLMGRRIKGVHRIGEGSVDIIEIEIRGDAPVADTPLTEFRLSAGGLVLLVNRGGDSFIPRGDYTFQRGDHIILIAKTGSETEIEKLFGSGL